MNRARTAADEGRKAEALKSFRAVLVLKPGDRRAQKGIQSLSGKKAKVFVQNKQHREAYQKGVAHYIEGELEKALELWEGILQEDPSHPAASKAVEKAKKEIDFLRKQGIIE